MNVKEEITNFGYFMITPVPLKFHFEGVNNKRAARQLLVICAAAQVVVIGATIVGPIVIEEFKFRKNQWIIKRTTPKN